MPLQTATGSLVCVSSQLNCIFKVFGSDSQTAKSNLAVGYNNAICLGGPTSAESDGSFGRHMQMGLTKNISDGSPSSQTPCLQLDYPGFWRFRWSVRVGLRSLYINAKQTDYGVSGQRPTIRIKSNSAVGLTTDLALAAASGNDWVTIGPLTFTATNTGMVWVELHNYCQMSNCPALFDHIVTT